jgi:photosystem II stability/assembly factor-like uncharacterized protein
VVAAILAAFSDADGEGGKIERFLERRDASPVAVLDPQGESVCLVGSYGKIVRTDDGGSTWAVQNSPSLAHLQKVVAWDRESLLAVGDKGTVLATRDAGKHWEQLALPADAAVDQLLSAQIDPETGQLWVVGRNGAVLASGDRGASWRLAHPAEDVAWNDIAVVEGLLWIVGEFGKVQTSRDDGESWQEVPVPTESSLNAIAFADAAHGVIVGLSGTILVTADGGRNWEQAASGVRPTYDVLWDGGPPCRRRSGMVVTADTEVPVAGRSLPNNFGWYRSPGGGSYFVCGAGSDITGQALAGLRAGLRELQEGDDRGQMAIGSRISYVGALRWWRSSPGHCRARLFLQVDVRRSSPTCSPVIIPTFKPMRVQKHFVGPMWSPSWSRRSGDIFDPGICHDCRSPTIFYVDAVNQFQIVSGVKELKNVAVSNVGTNRSRSCGRNCRKPAGHRKA